jgi:Fe-S-cluster containining protein
MELPEAEWAEVETGLSLLPEAAQREVAERLERGGRACPFLDEEIGRCRIYEHRPVACRTYGYYMERDGGRYCGIIREEVEQGRMEGVVWGNHAVVEQRVSALGRLVSLAEWRVLTGLLFFKRS